jgi:hypothetical protein
LIKPSALKPLFATIERTIVIKSLRTLAPADQDLFGCRHPRLSWAAEHLTLAREFVNRGGPAQAPYWKRTRTETAVDFPLGGGGTEPTLRTVETAAASKVEEPELLLTRTPPT